MGSIENILVRVRTKASQITWMQWRWQTVVVSGRAGHAVFAYQLLTVAIRLGQYLQGAMVTERSHTRINTLPCALNTHTLTHTLCPESPTQAQRRSEGDRERQRAIDHRCGDGVRRAPCVQVFPAFFSLSLSLWENTEGRSLLFTQLASWKGLLNMKYEESGEVRGRERGRKEGKEPSGVEGGRGWGWGG